MIIDQISLKIFGPVYLNVSEIQTIILTKIPSLFIPSLYLLFLHHNYINKLCKRFSLTTNGREIKFYYLKFLHNILPQFEVNQKRKTRKYFCSNAWRKNRSQDWDRRNSPSIIRRNESVALYSASPVETTQWQLSNFTRRHTTLLYILRTLLLLN